MYGTGENPVCRGFNPIRFRLFYGFSSEPTNVCRLSLFMIIIFRVFPVISNKCTDPITGQKYKIGVTWYPDGCGRRTCYYSSKRNTPLIHTEMWVKYTISNDNATSINHVYDNIANIPGKVIGLLYYITHFIDGLCSEVEQ